MSVMPEMDYFVDFLHQEMLPRGWTPWRTEWSIFSEDAMVAGQIDSLWIDSVTGELHMIDWKRCRHELVPHSGSNWNRFGLPPVEFMVDNSWSHYALQQNLYSAILKDLIRFLPHLFT